MTRSNPLPGSTEPTGCVEFDRARLLVAEQREDEALDLFEVAMQSTTDDDIRASAAAHVAGLLLGFGRPWEVSEFAATVRSASRRDALGDLLEAAACIQLGDATGALELLGAEGRIEPPVDQWYPCSAAAMYATRARALAMVGRRDDAERELRLALRGFGDRAELWETIASLSASHDLDPHAYLDRLPAARVLDVFGWIAGAPAEGLDAMAEALWQRSPGDVRVLAAVTLCAWRFEPQRALLWCLRLMEAGVADRMPLLERAEMVVVAPTDRVRAAFLARELDEDRARAALEAAAPLVDDEDLAPLLGACLMDAAPLADSLVVAAATTTVRCLLVATELLERDFAHEAYAVLVTGLQLPTADELSAEQFDASMPGWARARLAEIARRRGEHDVANVLDSVTV